ncbi:MAG TPA: sialidase family protein, partial [Gemmatimonadales bacterium]|nr:sialidase family protein [Gemmatimonadales bacterium]
MSTLIRTASAAALVLAIAACSRTASLAVEELSAPESGGSAGDAGLAREPRTGALFLAWVAGDSGRRHVWFSRSTDAGTAWTAPVQVTRAPDDVGPPHGEASPRVVAAGEGRVALVWSRSVPVPGRRFPASLIRFARSFDGGATWSEPVTLNDDSTAAPGTHTFHGAVWLGDSGIAAAWLDERGAADVPGHHHAPGDSAAPAAGDARIFMTTSPDFGTSWTPDRAAWGSVC